MPNKVVVALLVLLTLLAGLNLVRMNGLEDRLDTVSQKMSDVAWSLGALSMTLGESLTRIGDDTQSMKRALEDSAARDDLAAFDLCMAQAELHRLGKVLAPQDFTAEPMPCTPPLPSLELTLP